MPAIKSLYRESKEKNLDGVSSKFADLTNTLDLKIKTDLKIARLLPWRCFL